MATILCVDDDHDLTDLLRYALEREGETVCLAHSGRDALRVIRAQRFDLIVLDVNLLDIDGLQVLSALRRFSHVPVVLLAGRTCDEDIIAGFEQGGDDYVTKPFNVQVLIQRVKSILRRTMPQLAHLPRPADDPTYRIRDATFDATLNEIGSGEVCIKLTPVEGRILHLLVVHAGYALSAERIMACVWGYDTTSEVTVIKTHIRHLREKLGRLPGHLYPIRTVPGSGYMVQSTDMDGTERADYGSSALQDVRGARTAIEREPVRV